MKNKILSYFPKSKMQWKEFTMLAIPVIGGSLLFALNSFVDNFMVGHITGAQAGLFAVNSWTSIIMGIFAGTAATGSILVAQFYYSGNKEKVREISKIRFLIAITIALLFAISSWVFPEKMVKAFISSPKPNSMGVIDPVVLKDFNLGVEQGEHYIKFIAIMWILIAFTFNIGNMLRETGHAKFPFIAGIFGLISNITLNYLTMRTNVFGKVMDAEGAAIATIAARATVLIILLFATIKKRIPIIFWPWKIFFISKKMQKEFWKRSLVFLFTAATMIFITLRNMIYTIGYPAGSIKSSTDPSVTIGSADMLGISWAIFGVISVVFNAINIIVSKFVGGELGKNNIALAKENSKRVHGFMLVLTMPFVLLSIIAIFTLPYMHFLKDEKDIHGNLLETKNALILKQAGMSMIALTIFLPWWNWFVTSRSCTLAGGKVNLVSTIDVITAGPIFLGWMAIVMIFLGKAGVPFWAAYIVGFLADIPRGIAFMWVYYKKEWAFNITKDRSEAQQASAMDNIETETRHKE